MRRGRDIMILGRRDDRVLNVAREPLEGDRLRAYKAGAIWICLMNSRANEGIGLIDGWNS